MAYPWLTSNDIVAAVQRKISMPISQNTYSYDDSFLYSPPEDYDLWSKLIHGGVTMYNLNLPLITYNNVVGSLSKIKNKVIKKNSYKISKDNINKLYIGRKYLKFSPSSLLYFKIKKISFLRLNIHYLLICLKFIYLKGLNYEVIYYILFFYLKLLRNNYFEKEENFNFRR
jgi:hypothetical protein